MEYILNKSITRTTEHSKINDIHLDLDIPSINGFKNFKVSGVDYKEYDSNSFESRIGLSFDKSHNLDIEVIKDSDILISYDIDDILVDNININVLNNINTNITIKYTSSKDIYHISKLNIKLGKNSKAILNYVSLISKNSKSFVALENDLLDNSNLETNLVDLGGNIKVNNYYSNLIGEKSISTFNNIYIASDNDIIDMNYYTSILEPKAEGYINVSGVLKDKSHKSFKGTIDFVKGSTKSIGKELERVTLLSDDIISRSMPILLCGEEDVVGAHGVSTGKIDKEKLFYMMSRGMSKKEAEKLIIKSEANIALKNIDEDLYNEVINKIDLYI